MVCGPRPHLVIFSNVKINLKNCKMDHKRFVFRGPSSRQNDMAHIGARSHAKACHPGECAWPMVKHYCKLLP